MKNHLTFICTKDIHYAGQNPRARVDNYQLALNEKLLEIFKLAEKIEAAGILVAGDIFDSFYTTLPVIADLADILKKAPCPIYTIAGQHDEESHNPGSLRRSPYGLLVRLGLIENVAGDPRKFNFWTEDTTWFVAITGRHYDWEADKDPFYYRHQAVEADYVVHLAHGTLVDHDPPFDRYTHVDNLKTNADALVVGDYHPGIGVRQAGETLVVDPGGLARQKASSSDMERTIQVAVLTVSVSGCKAELVPLSCAKPGSEVLSREHLDAEKTEERQIESYLSKLGEGSARKFAETRDIMDSVAEEKGVPADVVSEALTWVGKAREELNK